MAIAAIIDPGKTSVSAENLTALCQKYSVSNSRIYCWQSHFIAYGKMESIWAVNKNLAAIYPFTTCRSTNLTGITARGVFAFVGGLKAIAKVNVFQMILLIAVSLTLIVIGVLKVSELSQVYHGVNQSAN